MLIILSKYIITCLPSDGSYITGIFAFCHTDHVTPAKMPLHFLNCSVSHSNIFYLQQDAHHARLEKITYPIQCTRVYTQNIESPQIKYPTLIISPDDAYPGQPTHVATTLHTVITEAP